MSDPKKSFGPPPPPVIKICEWGPWGEEIENNKQLPSYSRAFAQDARRSKCIAMLNNIRNPRSSLFILNKNITSLPVCK